MTLGSRVAMLDADARVRGTIAYTSNADVAGAAVGRLVRSQQPHARIRSIKTSPAAALPGVLAVLTGADLQQVWAAHSRSTDPRNRRGPLRW